jgi:hypothetical protein
LSDRQPQAVKLPVGEGVLDLTSLPATPRLRCGSAGMVRIRAPACSYIDS